MRTFPNLSDLSDVQITAPATGNALIYDGTKWTSDTIAIPEPRRIVHQDSQLLITDGAGVTDSNLALTLDSVQIMTATADQTVFRAPTTYWIAYVY